MTTTRTSSPDSNSLTNVGVAVFVDAGANGRESTAIDQLVPCLQSLVDALSPEVPIFIGPIGEAASTKLIDDVTHHRVTTIDVVGSGPGALVEAIRDRGVASVCLITAPVFVPTRILEHASELIDADPRVASVSFWSNAAGIASFPSWQGARDIAPSMHETQRITGRLRELSPAPTAVPLPFASGSIVVLSANALSMFGAPVGEPGDRWPLTLAKWSFEARRRGFVDLLDGCSFVGRPTDLAGAASTPSLTEDERVALEAHHPVLSALVSETLTEPDSPLRLEHRVARAKIEGLRVLVDGSSLGPTEMGTQVSIVAILAALCAHDEVAEVGVVIRGPVPPYAHHALDHDKVQLWPRPDGRLDGIGGYDIAHRLAQPDAGFSVAEWSRAASRVIVSMLDVIAYQLGHYQSSAQAWLDYRRTIRRVISEVDAVTLISEDAKQQLELERLPIEADRCTAIAYGTEHLRGDEAARVPVELVQRGFAAEQFMLCLGTNYTHKNRDLAIAATRELERRGRSLKLLLVGASVPYGSSRVAESKVSLGWSNRETSVIELADVSSEERNWLLRHASVLLYPTSAEGFGLVPFEAARFGTPTVNVSFGPLRELAGPTTSRAAAATWTPAALADAVETLLDDPDAARRQIDGLVKAGAAYTWSETARRLVEMYRDVLSRPSRSLRLPLGETP